MVACAPAPEADPVDGARTCDDPAAAKVGVMTAITFTQAKDGVSDGFDLDGLVTELGDRDGCGVEDFVDSAGNEGIDNAFGYLLPALEATEAIAVYGLIQDAINSGELLMMYELTGVDDLQNDDCVTLTIMRGDGTPAVGTDGFLVSGQTFDRSVEVAPSVALNAQIVDGVVEAEGLEVNLPLSVFEVTLDLHLQNVAVHLEFDENGIATGYLSGGFEAEIFVELVNNNPVDQILRDLVPLLLDQYADLDPFAAGECTHLSAGLAFDSTSAYFFEDPVSE